MANTLAYGFIGKEHLLADRVTTVGEEAVFDLVDLSLKEYTRQINAMLSSLVTRTTKHKFRYYLAGAGTLQAIDEYGDPKPVRPGAYFDVALPILGGGTAFGSSRVTRALQTVAEANRNTVDAMRRDADWMRRHMLASLFDNVAWVFSDDEWGNLTVQCLANTDAVTYVKTGGDLATDEHYLAQAAAIDDDNNPFPTIRDELREHPTNTGDIVCYCATNQTSAIEALTDFVAVKDDSLDYGVASTQIKGRTDAIRGCGDEVLGRTNKCWIVEWKALPDGYIIAHCTSSPVLGMREYPAAALQGFFMEVEGPGKSLRRTSLIRYAGFGVINRIAAVVQYIGDASYAIPTGYDNLIAV